MKQTICDICGSVINGKYTRLNLPAMYGGNVIQCNDKDDAYDVCKSCALELYNLIEKFKKEKR